MSQPIRDERDNITSGWVPYLMQDITTPPQSICLLLFINLLGNMGSTTVKAVPVWIWINRQGHVAFSHQGLFCLGVWIPLLVSSYKTLSLMCDIRWGRLDSREYTSTPCIRNFSGKGSCLPSYPWRGMQAQIGWIGALGSHLAQSEPESTLGVARGTCPWFNYKSAKFCNFSIFLLINLNHIVNLYASCKPNVNLISGYVPSLFCTFNHYDVCQVWLRALCVQLVACSTCTWTVPVIVILNEYGSSNKVLAQHTPLLLLPVTQLLQSPHCLPPSPYIQ